jgi:hypothetical protein
MNQKINSIKIFLLCPIPDEQKPINDYINFRKYFTKISQPKLPLESLNLFLIILNKIKKQILNSFLIFRWKEIEKRLTQPNIIYEEASWYDGQIWEKNLQIIKNDNLLIVKKKIDFLQ